MEGVADFRRKGCVGELEFLAEQHRVETRVVEPNRIEHSDDTNREAWQRWPKPQLLPGFLVITQLLILVVIVVYGAEIVQATGRQV